MKTTNKKEIELSKKEKKFVGHYLTHGDARRAFYETYHSFDSTRLIKMMYNPRIVAYCWKKGKDISKRFVLSQDWIFREIENLLKIKK